MAETHSVLIYVNMSLAPVPIFPFTFPYLLTIFHGLSLAPFPHTSVQLLLLLYHIMLCMQDIVPFITGNRELKTDYSIHASRSGFAFGLFNPIGFGRACHSQPTKRDPESDIQFRVCVMHRLLDLCKGSFEVCNRISYRGVMAFFFLSKG